MRLKRNMTVVSTSKRKSRINSLQGELIRLLCLHVDMDVKCQSRVRANYQITDAREPDVLLRRAAAHV